MKQEVVSNSIKEMMKNSAKACLVAAVALMLCMVGNQSAQATTGGSPYEVIPVVDINPDPNIVETYLVASESTVDIGNGVQAKKALTFKSCVNFDVCNDSVIGTIPGPEFRLKVGDTVIVHFQNKLKKEVAGIHWHGVEVNNPADGTPLTQEELKPGHKFDYKFTVTRPGVFWYHPHHHSNTNQVFQGLYGSLIVTEGLDEALRGTTLPANGQTKTLVLSDITVCKAPGNNDAVTFDLSLPHVSGSLTDKWQGKTPNILCDVHPVDEEGNLRSPFSEGEVPNIMTNPPVGEGQTVLTNGVNVGARAGSPEAPGALAAGAQTLVVQSGQGLRLQIINSSATRYMRLRLTDGSGSQVNLVRIGGQGGLLDQPRLEGGQFNYESGEMLIPPGSREDVVAAIPAGLSDGDVLTLWTMDYQRTGGFNNYAWIPSVPVAHLEVNGSVSAYTLGLGTALRTGHEVEVLALDGDSLINPPAGLPGIGPGPGITFTNSGGQLGVNDIQGEHDHSTRPGSTRYARVGDTLELTVTNNTGRAHHPFHLHGFSIQPKSLSKTGEPTYYFANEFLDELDIPSGYTLTFRVRLDDRPNFYDDKGKVLAVAMPNGGGLGRWLFHCHILFHATLGMISELDVVE